MDKTSWFFAFQCGICHPGGGPVQHDRSGNKYFDYVGLRTGNAQAGTFGNGLTALTPAPSGSPPNATQLDGDYGFIRPADGAPIVGQWQKNGVLEADCLMCHLRNPATNNYSWMARAGTIIGGGMFNPNVPAMGGNWAALELAPTAGAGWADVTYCTSSCGTPMPRATAVTVNYANGTAAGTLVDTGGQLAIPVGRIGPVPDSNCRGCHSTPDTRKSGRTLHDQNDVHVGAVGCTACHPSSADGEHQIGKGDITIGSVRNDLDNTGRSCADCHLGVDAPAGMSIPDPTGAHASIPSLHFASIGCQACHIRYLDDDPAAPGMQVPDLVIEMTSNGTQNTSPWSVYFRNDPLDPTVNNAALPGGRWYPGVARWKGKLTTVKPLLTTWFGEWLDGTGDFARIRPIPLRLVRKALTNAYPANSPRLAGLTLTPGAVAGSVPILHRKDEIAAFLQALELAEDTANPDTTARDVVVRPVMVKAGKVYYLESGQLRFFESIAAESHDFAVNHNVVPKRVAGDPTKPGPYGAGGCTDCHAPTSPFFFGKMLADPAQYDFLDEAGTQPNASAGQPLYVERWHHMGLSDFRVASLTAAGVPVMVRLMGSGAGNSVVGGGIDCQMTGGTCTTTVATNGTLTLTAQPGVGAAVRSWSGCTTVSADLRTCTLNVGAGAQALSATKLITVTFGDPAPTPMPTVSGLAVRVIGTGWGNVSGSGVNCNIGSFGACGSSLPDGTAVTLTATPGPNTWFVSWDGCTPVAGTPAQCTTTVAGVVNVTALFSNGSGGGPYSPTQTLHVRVMGSNGNVITGGPISCGAASGVCSAAVPTGDTVTLTAVPRSGSGFTRFYGCTATPTPTTCEVRMTASKTVLGYFNP